VEEIKDTQDIMREISEDLEKIPTAAWKKSAIAKLERAIDIFRKMKKYELQIGG